jgi:phage shock protein PspC (stress-responsive transcriptional regulator)
MICPWCRTENLPGATKCAACASWMVERPPVREWARAREQRLVAGVCRGLANRFGAPVAALRLLFIASLLLGGWGLLAYVALWIAMPLEPLALPAHLPPERPATAHGGPPPA